MGRQSCKNGGIYYYFSTKEEIVLACAEEAISRIEKAAFAIVLEDIKVTSKHDGSSR